MKPDVKSFLESSMKWTYSLYTVAPGTLTHWQLMEIIFCVGITNNANGFYPAPENNQPNPKSGPANKSQYLAPFLDSLDYRW